MKKKQLIALMCGLFLFSGCRMRNTTTDMNKTGKNNMNQTTENNPVNNAVNNTKDNIDSMTAYLKEKGIQLEEETNIDQMDFAAHEGRSFTVNGNKVYLYRMNTEDENMKKVMDEASKNGKVKVNIDGNEKEYQAQVKNDFLMVYDNAYNINDLLTAFPNYANSMANEVPDRNNPNNNETTPNDTNVPKE